MADMILNGERTNDFPLISGARQECLFSSLLLNIIMEISSQWSKARRKLLKADRL